MLLNASLRMTLSVDVVGEIDFAGSGVIVQHELAEVSRAIVLSNLTALVQGLETIKSDLQEIHVTTKNLQENSSNLARSMYDGDLQTSLSVISDHSHEWHIFGDTGSLFYLTCIVSHILSPCVLQQHSLLGQPVTGTADSFGGLVVSILASGTQVCGFKPYRSCWIFWT